MWSEKMKKNNAENHLHVACFIIGTIFLIIGAVTIYNLIRIKRYNDLNSELCDMYMSECDKDTEKNSPNSVNFGGIFVQVMLPVLMYIIWVILQVLHYPMKMEQVVLIIPA